MQRDLESTCLFDRGLRSGSDDDVRERKFSRYFGADYLDCRHVATGSSDYLLLNEYLRGDLHAVLEHVEPIECDGERARSVRVHSAGAVLAVSAALRELLDDVTPFRSALVACARSLALAASSRLFSARRTLSAAYAARCSLCHSFEYVEIRHI